MPCLTEKIAPFLSKEKPAADLEGFSRQELVQLIRYYYQSRPVGLAGKGKPALIALLTGLMPA